MLDSKEPTVLLVTHIKRALKMLQSNINSKAYTCFYCWKENMFHRFSITQKLKDLIHVALYNSRPSLDFLYTHFTNNINDIRYMHNFPLQADKQTGN